MTDKIAVGLAIVIVLALGLDLAITGGDGTLFLARKTLRLIHWVAFWR